MGINSSIRRTRERLVVLIFFLTPFLLFGLEMEVLPETIITNRVVTLKILTEIPIEEELDISKLEIPSGLALISGPIVRTYYARVDGLNQRFHQITWALRSLEPGIFELPPIEVSYNNETVQVEVPTIIVFGSDERNNNFPLIVDWEQSIKKEIFVGESLPLIVEASNLEEINFPDRIVSNPPRSGDMVEVSGLGEINPEEVAGEDLYRVSVASWIYTSFVAGRVTIPAVRVDINGLIRYTDPLIITVKPLPKVNGTGGVGEFIISSELSETQVTPDDLFHYKVKISGQGNLPYITFPNIEYPGLIMIDKEEDEWIDYSDKGYLGWREIDYTLQALDPGVKEIILPDVSWVDSEGKDIFFNGKVSRINVVSVKVIEEDILPFLTLMTATEIINSYSIFLHKNPVMWLSLLFSAVVILLINLFKSVKLRREKKVLLMTAVFAPYLLLSSIFVHGLEFQDELKKADSHILNGEFLEAIEIYDELEPNLSNNYGLYVNRSILWDKQGDISKSIYNIRIAERIAPGNRKINDIKSYLSDSEEASLKQAKTSNPINPDIVFILLIIFFNLLVVATLKLIKYRGISQFTMFFSALLFTMLSSVFLFFIDGKNSIDSGVINTGGAQLTKVPNENALEWMTLGEGHTVYINGEWFGKYLIETEYGLQGWVEKKSLLVLEDR